MKDGKMMLFVVNYDGWKDVESRTDGWV